MTFPPTGVSVDTRPSGRSPARAENGRDDVPARTREGRRPAPTRTAGESPNIEPKRLVRLFSVLVGFNIGRRNFPSGLRTNASPGRGPSPETSNPSAFDGQAPRPFLPDVEQPFGFHIGQAHHDGFLLGDGSFSGAESRRFPPWNGSFLGAEITPVSPWRRVLPRGGIPTVSSLRGTSPGAYHDGFLREGQPVGFHIRQGHPAAFSSET